VTFITEIYADKKYLLACKKIAGQNGDDLFQHVSLMLLEREQSGRSTFDNTKNLYTYFYRIAYNEYTNRLKSFHKQYRTPNKNTISINQDREAPLKESNLSLLDHLDTYARTPSKTKSEKFIKEVYLECTKPSFKGVTALSYQTGISNKTIYAALKRFKTLYDDNHNDTSII
jgi:DNA-directed RNA polymerase specialized sigma24 family protein